MVMSKVKRTGQLSFWLYCSLYCALLSRWNLLQTKMKNDAMASGSHETLQKGNTVKDLVLANGNRKTDTQLSAFECCFMNVRTMQHVTFNT